MNSHMIHSVSLVQKKSGRRFYIKLIIFKLQSLQSDSVASSTVCTGQQKVHSVTITSQTSLSPCMMSGSRDYKRPGLLNQVPCWKVQILFDKTEMMTIKLPYCN